MKKKGGAHETFYLLLKRDGVPPNMVIYGQKDQTLGSLRNNFQEAYCHINQMEAYYPCQLQDQGNIRELKKGAGSKMV